MSDRDLLNRLDEQLHGGQTKYTYYLLAIAAAAIAFTLTRTDGRPMSWVLLPAALAVASVGAQLLLRLPKCRVDSIDDQDRSGKGCHLREPAAVEQGPSYHRNS